MEIFLILFSDLLRKYDGSKPLLVGVPYPVVYEIPARRHYPQPPPPPTYPAIYERDLEHRSPYSPQPQRPHRDYPEPPIPDYPPTYSNQQLLPPTPTTYPDPEYDPLLFEGELKKKYTDFLKSGGNILGQSASKH